MVSRETRRQYLAKGKVKLQPMWASLNVFTSYQVQGAYAHLGQTMNEKVHEALRVAASAIYFDDPLRMSIPYEYLAKRLPEPPDNAFMTGLAFIAIAAILMPRACQWAT
jgi:hypothetical protein